MVIHTPDPFQSSRYSIEFAKRRAQELKTKFDAFRGSNPYGKLIEHDVDRAEDVHKVVLTKPMPWEVSGLAFEAVNHLRASLDQAGYAVACASGNKGKNAHFPFADTAAGLENTRSPKGRSRDIPKEIFDLMVTFQPHKGGDHLLWSVNQLANTPKHEAILEVAPVITRMGGSYSHAGTTKEATWPPRWDRAKNEMVLVRVPHGDEPNYEFKMRILIEFVQVDPIRRQPADAVLGAMASKVEGIFSAIEAESRRLGLIV